MIERGTTICEVNIVDRGYPTGAQCLPSQMVMLYSVFRNEAVYKDIVLLCSGCGLQQKQGKCIQSPKESKRDDIGGEVCQGKWLVVLNDSKWSSKENQRNNHPWTWQLKILQISCSAQVSLSFCTVCAASFVHSFPSILPMLSEDDLPAFQNL